MEKLLDFLVRNTEPGALRNLLRHLLVVRSASEFWDCVFLMTLIFIGCYLLLFRLRLFMAYQTPKEKNKQKRGKRAGRQKSAGETRTTNLFAWLYLLNNEVYRNYQEKHPKGCKVLFVYNCMTVSAYLLSALLVLAALVADVFRTLFLDLFFIHMYINVLPKFLFDTLIWIHHRISSADSIE